MAINVDKSCCMRIGPRFETHCCEICTMNGHSLQWVNEMRYLGIFMISSGVFSCSFDKAKRANCGSLNAIFGKPGRFASAKVILQLVESECLPILIYGTEAYCLKKSDINSLDFAVNRFPMKLFKTNNMSIIDDCRMYTVFKLPSALLVIRKASFLDKYSSCNKLTIIFVSSF